jgi:hypothetical protein
MMEITVAHAKKMKGAILEVLELYKDCKTHQDFVDRKPGILCPLCRNSFSGCDNCPWVLFKKDTCRKYHEDAIPLRRRRLRGWLKRCDNIIKKGGN